MDLIGNALSAWKLYTEGTRDTGSSSSSSRTHTGIFSSSPDSFWESAKQFLPHEELLETLALPQNCWVRASRATRQRNAHISLSLFLSPSLSLFPYHSFSLCLSLYLSLCTRTHMILTVAFTGARLSPPPPPPLPLPSRLHHSQHRDTHRYHRRNCSSRNRCRRHRRCHERLA